MSCHIHVSQTQGPRGRGEQTCPRSLHPPASHMTGLTLASSDPTELAPNHYSRKAEALGGSESFWELLRQALIQLPESLSALAFTFCYPTKGHIYNCLKFNLKTLFTGFQGNYSKQPWWVKMILTHPVAFNYFGGICYKQQNIWVPDIYLLLQ